MDSFAQDLELSFYDTYNICHIPEFGLWLDFNRSVIGDAESKSVDPSALYGNADTIAPAFAPEDPRELYITACEDLKSAVRAVEDAVQDLLPTQGTDSWNFPSFTTDNVIVMNAEHHLAYCLAAAEAAAMKVDHYHYKEESPRRRTVLVSDGSDISDDDKSTSLHLNRIFHGLHSLAQIDARQFWAITDIEGAHRKLIHASAHCLGLGHITLGEEKILLLSKRNDIFTTRLKKAIRKLHRSENSASLPDCSSSACTSQKDSRTRLLTPGTTTVRGSMSGGTFHANNSSDSVASSISIVSSLKRRRQYRQRGGFECHHSGCHEVFDRRCDLTQHERSHLPYDQRPYGCESCEKRFLFPKDLRRHESTHASPQDDENLETLYEKDETLCKRRPKEAKSRLPWRSSVCPELSPIRLDTIF